MYPGRRLPLLLILVGVVLYAVTRGADVVDFRQQAARHTGPSPAALQQIAAGPCRGLGADFDLLSIYSIYDQILHAGLDASQKALAWRHLTAYLERAQTLDPWFWDIYRLSGGLLGFQKGYASTAIDIMEKGAAWRSWDWETPFIAGFLSYDRLHDYDRAYRLMRESAGRPGAPPIVIGLAANFLMHEKGTAASLQFLQYMLKTMPKGYQGPIQKRIDKLRKQGKADEE